MIPANLIGLYIGPGCRSPSSSCRLTCRHPHLYLHHHHPAARSSRSRGTLFARITSQGAKHTTLSRINNYAADLSRCQHLQLITRARSGSFSNLKTSPDFDRAGIHSTMGAEVILFEGQEREWGTGNLKLRTTPPGHAPDTREWPTEVKGGLCWDSSSFQHEQDYTLALDGDEVAEVKVAVRHFNELELYGSEVSPYTFPLPTLGPKLLKLAVEVHRGKGFVAIRGLRPDEFSPEDNVVLFLGLSSYIGPKRGRQDEDGNMLMHIRDAKLSTTPQSDRPIRYSSRASTFHTDTFCDILALQTRNRAVEGGRNMLTSSWTVYNKLRATRPDIIDLLAQPIWPFDSRGKFFDCSVRPLLFYHGGRIIMNFAREPLLGLDGIGRAAGLPALTPAQREALDVVEQIATESQIMLDAEQGDMLFINNHAVLHSREAFSDAPESARYLVRMWLRNPALAWKIPRALQEGNSRIYDDNELGERWNIVDTPKIQFRLSERLTS